MSLKIIDSFRSKKRSFTPGMSGLNTDFARRVAFRISLRLDNIREDDSLEELEEFFKSLTTLSASSALTLISLAVCITTLNVL